MLLFALRCSLFCIADHVKPPPFFDFCSIPLHLWPTIKSLKDPPPLMCPWWGKDYIPWCCSGCFCIHRERCRVSCLMKINSHSFIAFSSVFSLTDQSMDSICTLSDVIIVDFTRTNLISWVALFHGVFVRVVAQVKEGLYYDCYPINMFLPLAIKVF